MGWFQNLCRNVGLTIHNVKHPNKDARESSGSNHVTKHEVQEQKIDENITLRRTIVEEVEMKPGADKDQLSRYESRKER